MHRIVGFIFNVLQIENYTLLKNREYFMRIPYKITIKRMAKHDNLTNKSLKANAFNDAIGYMALDY